MEYDKKFDNLVPGTVVTASYTEGRKVFKGQITTINREHPEKPPYFVKLEKGFPEKSLWFYPWEILTANMGEARGVGRIRMPRTRMEQQAMRAFPNAAGVDDAGNPVDGNGVRLGRNRVPRIGGNAPMGNLDLNPDAVAELLGFNNDDEVLHIADPYNDAVPVAGVVRANDAVAEAAGAECLECGRDRIPVEGVLNVFEPCACQDDEYREEDDEDYDPR